MKLSEQAAGAIMLAVQKGMIEAVDISDILLGLELEVVDGKLVVDNPPTVDYSAFPDDDDDEEDLGIITEVD